MEIQPVCSIRRQIRLLLLWTSTCVPKTLYFRTTLWTFSGPETDKVTYIIAVKTGHSVTLVVMAGRPHGMEKETRMKIMLTI